jgi:outer membrane cobalamin receptor
MRSWTDGHSAVSGETDGGRGGMLRPLRRSWMHGLAAGLVVAMVACGATRPGDVGAGAPAAAKVVTAEQIVASGAKNAWDALRLVVPNVQLRETSRGQPARIQRRGRGSIYLDDQVRVILDHVRVYDLQILREVAATEILTIELFTGLDATTYYGASSTAGLIVITTTTGR